MAVNITCLNHLQAYSLYVLTLRREGYGYHCNQEKNDFLHLFWF